MKYNKRRTKIRLYIAICILILAFLVFDKLRENREKLIHKGETPSSITSMPEWDLQDLEGNKMTNEFLKGDIALITFWAIECEACLEEIPVLKDLEAKYSDKGFKIVAVVLDVREDMDIDAFVKGEKINYIVLRGDADIVKKFAHVQEVPESFLFDRKGNLIYYKLGKFDQTQITSLIEEQL